MMPQPLREYSWVRKAGNAGLVTTTVPGPDLCHTTPLPATAGTTGARSAIITKIMAYNNTGAAITLIFGTMDRNPAGAAFVQLLPTLAAVDGFDNEWTEADIPAVEFISWPQLTAAGRTGDIWVTCSAAAVLVQIEVRELGV